MATGTVRTKVTRSGSNDLAASIEAASKSSARELANDIVKEARLRAPVGQLEYVDADGDHPGALKSSIRAVKVREGVWAVEVRASYGAYVEYGTRFMHAQPFLRPAVRIARRKARSLLKRELAKKVSG